MKRMDSQKQKHPLTEWAKGLVYEDPEKNVEVEYVLKTCDMNERIVDDVHHTTS